MALTAAGPHVGNFPDGVEPELVHAHDAGSGLMHEYDGDGFTDLNDEDSDDDGLEDINRNGRVNPGTACSQPCVGFSLGGCWGGNNLVATLTPLTNLPFLNGG